MRYAITTVTPPEVEPVDLALAKAHLRIDHDEEDDLIRAWIGAARQLTEEYTGRRWVTQTLRLTMSGFPVGHIELPVRPVGVVTEFYYLDEVGDQTDVEPADYQMWLDHNPPLITFAPDGEWPDTEEGRLNAVTIEFTVGGAVENVPEMVKAAMLQIIGQYDEARGDQNWLTSRGIPPSAKALLNMLDTGAYLSRY
jgi:uncharacterized phiE125 gp8 family phage protein